MARKNKEADKAYNQKYWAAHKVEINNRRKEDYKINKEKILARNKKWIADNREHWNAYQRAYRKKRRAALDMLKED